MSNTAVSKGDGQQGSFYQEGLIKSFLLRLHRKKSLTIFPSPAGISLTKLSMGGKYDVIHKSFLPRERLVSEIPAGDGNIEKLFYGVLDNILSVPTF